jgi:hypothetical protein
MEWSYLNRTHYIRDNRQIKLLEIETNRISIENARGKIIRICFEIPFTRKKIRGETYKRWDEAIFFFTGFTAPLGPGLCFQFMIIL